MQLRCKYPYIGVALRKPDTPPFGRCTDSDFMALPACYVDIDDDLLEVAREVYRQAGAPPTAAVVTGRHPHPRAQLLWRLETPERDPDLCRRQNLALAHALGGDLTVVNPSRVLRLGGSIAWPRKPARVLERTEFSLLDADSRPRAYLDGQLQRAYPPVQAKVETPAALNIGAPDGVSVESCLARIRAGDHWHDNLVRLTGNWIGRGWTDAEILLAAENLTLPGWTAVQTRREVTQMIEGGRAKWNVANPEYAIEDRPAASPLAPRLLEELNVAMLPRRRWLLGRALLRRKLTVHVAAPGVGKSTLALARAVAAVTGREITGEPVHEPAKVWLFNNEDDLEDLERQLAAVLQHWDIPFAEVRGQRRRPAAAHRPQGRQGQRAAAAALIVQAHALDRLKLNHAASSHSPSSSSSASSTARQTRASDGDIIIVAGERVRLQGIDVPELRLKSFFRLCAPDYRREVNSTQN